MCVHLEKLKVDELKELMSQTGVYAKGRKADLINALVASGLENEEMAEVAFQGESLRFLFFVILENIQPS